jgi:hypothetical protein
MMSNVGDKNNLGTKNYIHSEKQIIEYKAKTANTSGYGEISLITRSSYYTDSPPTGQVTFIHNTTSTEDIWRFCINIVGESPNPKISDTAKPLPHNT